MASLLLSPLAPAEQAWSEALTDTRGHWASSYIEWALDEGLAKGYEDGTFQPDRPVSEAEFLAMLLRAYGSAVPDASTGAQWYDSYYQYAEGFGWPVSFNNERGSFRRGQAALLMATAASGKRYSENEAIQWLLDEGISKGRTSATIKGFVPDGGVTRAEALTFLFMLKDHTRQLSSTKVQESAGLNGIDIGDQIEKLTLKLGKPDRIDPSEYSYSWYVYNQNYAEFAMYGVLDGKIAAEFSISKKGWRLPGGLTTGLTLGAAQKGLTGVSDAEKKETYYTYTANGIQTTLFIDSQDGDKISGILRQNSSVSKQAPSAKNTAFRDAMERQLFDLANAERALRGIPVLQWDKLAGSAARDHSENMRDKQFFSHKNLDNKTPFDRMKAKGISYRLASENIAAGFDNSIFAHYTLLNSTSGHRETLLNGKLTRLGTGIALGGNYQVYYTQDFYTPLEAEE
ncbi:S-layer homology domain-containing protein [Paenibacillus sp. 1011MAR3C5]|uniref:S-layer homology domain-containing protein n=1 Tax=Paenibacillus sp. 1011MAR3C5 TaxID=1675787 RepID=UPI0016030E09|nr:S-layer homology domain-containing protein [Paenibacillus sp. 1011MAR3C5]